MDAKVKEEERQKLKAIVRVLHSNCEDLELEITARICVRELINIADCNVCATMLVDGSRIEILAERGFTERYGKIVGKADMQLIEYVVDTGQAIFTTDARSSPVLSNLGLQYMVSSLICTPVILNGDVKGIIYVDSVEKNAFEEGDMELTKLLANEISVAFERSLQQSQIQDALTKDTVTGCFNRRKFDQDIITEIANAKECGRHLSLVMVDIEWFTVHNRHPKQHTRDKLLQELAHLLINNLRPYDIVYRYDRNRFAVLMVDTNKSGASSACMRLEKIIGQEQLIEKKVDQLDRLAAINLAVASFHLDANSGEELVQTAEAVLYKAKHLAGSQVCVFGMP